MPSAHLLIQVEGGSDARRAFASIAADAKKATDAMSAISRESAKKQEKDRDAVVKAATIAAAKQKKLEEDLAAARQQIIFRANAAIARMNSQRAKQDAASVANTEKVMAKLAADWVKSEQKKTAASEKETAKRDAMEAASAARRERRQQQDESYYDRSVALAERASQRKQQADENYYDRSVVMAERAAKRRADAEIRSFRAAGRNIGQGLVSHGISIAGNVSGQIQDVRARTASNESTINDALYQAGGGGNRSENAAEVSRVIDFARRNHIDAGALAGGLKAAQEQFSVLGDAHTSHAGRMSAIDQQMQIGLFAANTRQDPAEVMRVAGMMQHAEITGATQRQGLLALTGLAQHGAIELSSVSQEALGPLMANMAGAVARARVANPNMTSSDLGRVNMQSMVDTFATMEAAKGMGKTTTWTGNVMDKLTTNLGGTAFQQKMLTNLQTSHQDNAIRELFETDAHGNRRLKSQYTTALGLSGGLQTAFHGNTEEMMNVFAGTGHGNPQSLAINERKLMRSMMSGGEEIERLRRGASAGTDFTEADVDRGAKQRENETATQLLKDQQEHEKALGDNTSAINQMSNSFTSWVARNPVTTALASAAVPTILGKVGGAVGAAVGGGAATGASEIVAGGAPALLTAAKLAGVGGIAGGLGLALATRPYTGAERSRELGRETNDRLNGRPSQFNASDNAISNLVTSLSGWVDALRGKPPIQVTIDAHTATQIQQQATTGAHPTPPEQRR